MEPDEYVEHPEQHNFAVYRKSPPVQAGRVVINRPDGSVYLSEARLIAGVAGIVSDTSGLTIGWTEERRTPVAVAGRVLAYPMEPKDSYRIGDPVCSGINGTVSFMSQDECRRWPECIIGQVAEIPTYEFLGEGEHEIFLDGRIWIQVK